MGQYVSVASRSRNDDPTPFRPAPENVITDSRLRLSLFSHDQKVSNPSVSTFGPPRVIRSSTVSLLVLTPAPISQLFTNIAFAFTLAPFTSRSPSLFQFAYSLTFSWRGGH